MCATRMQRLTIRPAHVSWGKHTGKPRFSIACLHAPVPTRPDHTRTVPSPPRCSPHPLILTASPSPLYPAPRRRTSGVPLLSVVDHEAHHQGWRGALLAAQHTTLDAWQPAPELLLPAPSLQGAGDALQHRHSQQSSSAGGSFRKPPTEAGGSSFRKAPSLAAEQAAGALQLPPHVYYIAGSR